MSDQIRQQLKVLTGWDDTQSTDIVLIVKGEDRKTYLKKLQGREWYFAIKTTDFDELGTESFDNFNTKAGRKVVQRFEQNGEFTKIICDQTQKDPMTSKLLGILKGKDMEVYEADLSRTKRWMIDKKVPIADKLNILYFDIETDDSKGGIAVGRDQILSWAAYNNHGKSWSMVEDDEKVLLQGLIKLIDKHDVFVGWNSMKFDLPYVQARMKVHGLGYRWRQRVHVDLMKRSIKMYSYEMDKIGLTGFALNEVARVFLKEAKVFHEETIKEMFDNNRELLIKYNRKDAELLMKLDAKLGIIDLMINECVWTGTFLDRFYVGELLDNYMLRRSKELKQYLHSRPSIQESDFNKSLFIVGGYVMPPITGLYTDVRIFDFKSLYPSMIVSWNIGPDSIDDEKSAKGDKNYSEFLAGRKIEDIVFVEWHKFLMQQKRKLDPKDECYQTANNNFFRKNIDSFISFLIKELLELRAEMKKKLVGLDAGTSEYGSVRSSQAIVKELANSMYGITGDRNSRYFNKNIAESITITGQYMNKATSYIIEEFGYKVIYGDTDSIFAPIPQGAEDMEKFLKRINVRLKESLNKRFSLHENIVQLEYEKAYRKMVMVDKKRYSGTMMMMNDKPSEILFSKGLEDVKKNTIGIAKRKMRELMIMITKEDKGLEDVVKWLDEFKKYVFESTDIKKEDLTISTRLSKPTYSYATKSAHVQLAEKMIAKGLIVEPSEDADSWGTRIDYIIETASPKQVAVHVDDFDGTWDKNYYWDTQIYAPIQRIMQVIWPEHDWEAYQTTALEKKRKKEEKEAKKKQRDELAIIREQKKKERAEARVIREAEKLKKQEEREAKKQLKLKL